MSEHDVSGACPSGTVAFVPSALSPDGLDQRLQSTGGAHTPGPWAVDPKVPWVILGAHGQHVADVYVGGLTRNGEVNRKKQDANARLTAAAPELLAALKSSVGAMEVLGHPANYGALAKANAAIAKAEGR